MVQHKSDTKNKPAACGQTSHANSSKHDINFDEPRS